MFGLSTVTETMARQEVTLPPGGGGAAGGDDFLLLQRIAYTFGIDPRTLSSDELAEYKELLAGAAATGISPQQLQQIQQAMLEGRVPLPPVAPVVKTCHCSGLCSCGCNEGLECDCKTYVAPPAGIPGGARFAAPVRYRGRSGGS